MQLWHQILAGAIVFLFVVIHFWLLVSIYIRCANTGDKLHYFKLYVESMNEMIAKRFNTNFDAHDETRGDIASLDKYLRMEFDILVHHFQADIAASILEAHFRKKKDAEGIMLVTSLHSLLQRKVQRKPKSPSNEELAS